MGAFHRCNVFFILYKPYFLSSYTNPTPNPSPYRKRSAFLLGALHFNMGTWENVFMNHLLLVIPMLYPCHYTNLCPQKSQKVHTHTHTEREREEREERGMGRWERRERRRGRREGERAEREREREGEERERGEDRWEREREREMEREGERERREREGEREGEEREGTERERGREREREREREHYTTPDNSVTIVSPATEKLLYLIVLSHFINQRRLTGSTCTAQAYCCI